MVAHKVSCCSLLLLLKIFLSSIGVSQAALIHNITRVFNNGDIFNNPDVNCRPMHCSVFGANSARNSGCNCQCPLNRPAFLQHVKKCADSISDCRMLYFGIYGQTESRVKMPTVFLPLSAQLLSPSLPLDWAAAGIKPDASDGSVPCQLSSVGYLTHSGWIPLENPSSLFSLLNSNQYTHIQWLGNKQDQQSLTGKIVEVSLQCQDAETPDVCAVFRVIGRDVEAAEATSNSQSTTANQERNSQLGLIVGIVCGVILAMSLAVITVFWTICWKQQKDRLAKKIQIHLLLQQRLNEQNNAGVFRHFPRPYVGPLQEATGVYQNYPFDYTNQSMQRSQPTGYGLYASGSPQHVWNGKMANGGQQAPYAAGQQRPTMVYKDGAAAAAAGTQTAQQQYGRHRKRLYFDPEFFQVDKMANPPPHAEQFLTEVRSMIDLARMRIRGRRYTPSLVVIPEEERASSSHSSIETDLDKMSAAAAAAAAAPAAAAAAGCRMGDEDAVGHQMAENVAVWLSRHAADESPTADRHLHSYFYANKYGNGAEQQVDHHRHRNVNWSTKVNRKQSDNVLYNSSVEQSPVEPTRRASWPSLVTADESWHRDGAECNQATQKQTTNNTSNNIDNVVYYATDANNTAAMHRAARHLPPPCYH